MTDAPLSALRFSTQEFDALIMVSNQTDAPYDVKSALAALGSCDQEAFREQVATVIGSSAVGVIPSIGHYGNDIEPSAIAAISGGQPKDWRASAQKLAEEFHQTACRLIIVGAVNGRHAQCAALEDGVDQSQFVSGGTGTWIPRSRQLLTAPAQLSATHSKSTELVAVTVERWSKSGRVSLVGDCG